MAGDLDRGLQLGQVLPAMQTPYTSGPRRSSLILFLVLDLQRIDLDEIATALQDQNTSDRAYLIDPRTGEIALWTTEGGIDGQHRVEVEELELIPIDALPSWHALHDTRALRRAVAWLAGHNLVEAEAADRFYAEHPDPALP